MNRLSPSDQIAEKIAAIRLLPKHASPRQPFPVVIKVHSKIGQPVSFILKEFLPQGVQGIKGEPPLVTLDGQKGTIKWLSNTENEEALYFAYLAQADLDLVSGRELSFYGEVIVKGEHAGKRAIGGSSTIKINDSHWVDAKSDNIIGHRVNWAMLSNARLTGGSP